MSSPINTVYKFNTSPDKQLADSFTAIINYLIDLFLKDALAKPIKFPVPDLSKIIKFGNIVFTSAELRGPFLRNNSFYVMLGEDLGGPVQFPSELIPNFDIRTGISQSGLNRIVDGLMPYQIPNADINHPYNTFYIHADHLQIDNAIFDIKAGNNVIGTKIFFSGNFKVDIQFDVPIVNKHVDIPIVIPFDKLSHYSGGVTPYLVVDKFTNNDEKVHLHLTPLTKFLDDWYAVLITDYRDYFYQIVRDWVNKFKDNFIVKFLRHIPIIGWILDRVFDGAAWILGYLTGALLDSIVSIALTVLINTLGRAAISLFINNNFDVYQLAKIFK